jgi:hypothetical protein
MEMIYSKKLKQDRSIWIKLSVGLFAICAIILIRIYKGPDKTFLIGALIMFLAAIWNLLLMIRTRNMFYLIGVVSFLCLMTANLIRVFYSEEIAEYILIIVLVFMIWYFYVVFTRKIKFRNREILELAARPINETSNGYTSRPYVFGKADFSKSDIKGFSSFLLKHCVALPYYKNSRLVLLLEFNLLHLSYILYQYNNRTHVIFNDDGDIIVNISRKDYSKYKEELTFDQLCFSLGKLFREFLELYTKDRATSIIDKINSVKENPFG